LTSPGTLYGVGVGPGDPELLTLKGLRVLQSAGVVFVPVSRPGARSLARTIVDRYLDPSKQRIVELVIEMHDDEAGLAAQWAANAAQVREVLAGHADAAYLTEGDPLFYSTFIHLADAMRQQEPDVSIVVVPGVSSIHAAAAAVGLNLVERDERLAVLPATYEGDNLAEVLDNFDTVVLLKVASAMDRVLHLLEERGLSRHAVYVSRCGWPEEQIVTDVLSLRGRRLDYFSLLIVRRPR
jgi:precorrin-2/cobalt-factor-2 C20-methyltransferase